MCHWCAGGACDNDAQNAVSGDVSAWVPSPSPQGGASNDNTQKVASDNVLSQDNVQNKVRDGHKGVGHLMMRRERDKECHVALQHGAQ